MTDTSKYLRWLKVAPEYVPFVILRINVQTRFIVQRNCADYSEGSRQYPTGSWGLNQLAKDS